MFNNNNDNNLLHIGLALTVLLTVSWYLLLTCRCCVGALDRLLRGHWF